MGRRLGQHFLSDPAVLDRIVNALLPTPDDVVVEVGPGQGTLTRRLAPRVRRVVAVETDPHLVDTLTRPPPGAPALPENVWLVAGDALEVDWPGLVEQAVPGAGASGAYKVAGNIPYYITSPLLEKAVTPPMAAVVVFLVQREVADRLGAVPGEKTYGALTVGVRAVAKVERLFTVKAGAFRPPPSVDSAVVRLRPLASPLVDEKERAAFRQFVVALFGQRRKQLVGAVRTATGAPRERVAATLADLDLDERTRGETLSPERLAQLFRAVRGLAAEGGR